MSQRIYFLNDWKVKSKTGVASTSFVGKQHNLQSVAFKTEYAFKQIESQTKDVFSQEMPRTPVWAEFQSVAAECLDRFPAQIVASPSYILFSDCSQC